MDTAFEVHILNEEGKAKSRHIALAFDSLYIELQKICGTPTSGSTREMAIVRTKLEEACFFAKKSMANVKENQQ